MVSNQCRFRRIKAILKKVDLLFVVAAQPQLQTRRSAIADIALGNPSESGFVLVG
jgi:hypothetical protein